MCNDCEKTAALICPTLLSKVHSVPHLYTTTLESRHGPLSDIAGVQSHPLSIAVRNKRENFPVWKFSALCVSAGKGKGSGAEREK